MKNIFKSQLLSFKDLLKCGTTKINEERLSNDIFPLPGGTLFLVEIVTNVSTKNRVLTFGVQHSKKSCVTDSYFVNSINYEVSLYAVSA